MLHGRMKESVGGGLLEDYSLDGVAQIEKFRYTNQVMQRCTEQVRQGE